jgi:hypothetical protein
MRPQVMAGLDLDQAKDQARLPARSSYRTGQMIARRSRLGGDGNAGPKQRGRKLVGDAASDLAMFRTCLDRTEGDRRPIAARGKERWHRREGADEYGLSLQGLRRRLAVAAAIFDGKPPQMREAAAQRDVHHFRIGHALEQRAARAGEPDVAQRDAGRLAEKDLELPLQRPARHAGDGSKIGHAPVALDIGAHRLERMPDAARQHRYGRACVGSLKHGRTAPTITIPSVARCELCHTWDNGVVNWIRAGQGPR